MEIYIQTDIGIDTEELNEMLLTLPTKTYLSLYHKMHDSIFGHVQCSLDSGVEE